MTPPTRPKLMEAVDRALAGDWERAHLIVQEHEGDPIADWIHAVVHRMEGDPGNARYWYGAVATRRAKISRRTTSSGRSGRRWAADERSSFPLVRRPLARYAPVRVARFSFPDFALHVDDLPDDIGIDSWLGAQAP